MAIPGAAEFHTQHAEALACDAGEERLLPGEVAIERGARHAELLTNPAQGEVADAVGLNRAQRLLEQGMPQVAVMVLVGLLLFRPFRRGTNHVR